jgi:putative transposase
MKNEIEVWKFALELFLSGESKSEIASKTGKTRQWVHKWIGRYKANPEGNWFESESRAPKSAPLKTAPQLEQDILEVRNRLEGTKYAQIGSVSIQYEFISRGFEAPETWTINRVLKRNGKVKKGKRYLAKKKIIPSCIALSIRWIWLGQDTLKEIVGSIA